MSSLNDLTTEFIVTGLLVGITFLKSTDWYHGAQLSKQKYRQAELVDIFEQAVAKTYNDYVRDAKSEGNLDKSFARNMATEIAQELAQERRIKIDDVIPDKFIEAAVTKAKQQ